MSARPPVRVPAAPRALEARPAEVQAVALPQGLVEAPRPNQVPGAVVRLRRPPGVMELDRQVRRLLPYPMLILAVQAAFK